MNTHSVEIYSGIQTSDGAGVQLKRIIGQPQLNNLDPFLLLDAFSSDNPDDYIAGFPPHPHRGFETVSYMLKGKMRHKDNAGHEGVIEEGGIQWMTAGKGIIHSEMPEQENGMLSGFQLWINLPSSHKMSQPSYQEFSQKYIPIEHRTGTKINVIAGKTSQGTEGPIKQELTKPIYFDVTLDKDNNFDEDLPSQNNSFIYVVEGEVVLDKQHIIKNGQIAILKNAVNVNISTTTNSQFLLISGQPLNEPIARSGPFVMNTRDEIHQAYKDYDMGNF